MNTQLIVDNVGNIVFLQAGFLGAQNDAANFLLMQRMDLVLTMICLPVLYFWRTRNTEIRKYHSVIDSFSHGPNNAYMAIPDQRWAPTFNRRLSRYRVIVEHTIKHLKTSYLAVGTIWRHPRWFQPVVVELATFLAQRHVVYYFTIYNI
jgi:hypothetical protein